MCFEKWKAIGFYALALGISIVLVAIIPTGLLLLLIAILLIGCGIILLKER